MLLRVEEVAINNSAGTTGVNQDSPEQMQVYGQ